MKKIYTKTGDSGQTTLGNGLRVSKDDLRVEAYGSLDELNSLLGVVANSLQHTRLPKIPLEKIQADLMLINANLANPDHPKQLTKLKKRVTDLENWIDQMEKELPPLSNFVLPGGGEVGSLFQFSRTVCRRAERQVIKLTKKEDVPPEILIFLNRLSDLLFTLALWSNNHQGIKEIVWKGS